MHTTDILIIITAFMAVTIYIAEYVFGHRFKSNNQIKIVDFINKKQ
jgi:hypothetical protein